ncbi:hypothetical protein [Methanobacterium oryzae]|uniref:hypothetical protein n=1 Tax=Methanobacterium oryzae TaxID=69540 RepID=UPI003D241B9B
MVEKILLTNLKSKDNIQKAISTAKPDKMIIISTRKAKFSEFEVKTEYLKVKNQFESIIHKINPILTAEEDISIIVKPDSIGTYILWLAQIHSLNPAYIVSHGEIQQIPIIPTGKLGDKQSDILKLADCHGFIDPKSINKEYGISEEEAKGYLEEFSKMGILKFLEKREFEVGDMKEHPYYDTDLLEKGKEIEDFYVMTELGRLLLYVDLTKE